MPRYHAYGKVVGTKYLGEFEAANPGEAKKMAMGSDKAYVGLCYQCERECQDAEVVDVDINEIKDKDH